MPYNTTAIPPRKEATGQTQLPLTRVKKIIAIDPDVTICSNNAAFVITLATEMFIQHLATEAQNMAKLERKPRRNVQYKDVANAVLHHDNLEFLEDVVPKTATFKQVRDQAAATRAKLSGEKKAGEASESAGGKTQGSLVNGRTSVTNGFAASNVVVGAPEDDPSAQLELEMRQAARGHDGDVFMTG